MSSPRHSRENTTQINSRSSSTSPVRKQSNVSRPPSSTARKLINQPPTDTNAPRLADLASDDKEKIALIVQQFTQTCRHRDELTEIVKEQESQVHHLIRERWTTTQENTRLAKEVESLRERLSQAEQETSDQISDSQAKLKKLYIANRQLATICSDQKEQINRHQKKAADMETKHTTMVTAMQCLELKLHNSRKSIKKLKSHMDKARMERCLPGQKRNTGTQTDRTIVCCERCSCDSASLQAGQPTIHIIRPQGRVVGLPPSGYLPQNISSRDTAATESTSVPIYSDTYPQSMHASVSHPPDTQYAPLSLLRDMVTTPDTRQTSTGVLSQPVSRKTSQVSSGPLSQQSTEVHRSPPPTGNQPGCFMSMENLPRQIQQHTPASHAQRPQPAVRQVIYSKSANGVNGQPLRGVPPQPAASRWTQCEQVPYHVPGKWNDGDVVFPTNVNDGSNSGRMGEDNGVNGGVLTWAATVTPGSPHVGRTPQACDAPAAAHQPAGLPPQSHPCLQPQPAARPQPPANSAPTPPHTFNPVQRQWYPSPLHPGTPSDCRACLHQAAADGQLTLSPQAVEDWMLHKLFFSGRAPCEVSHPNIH